MPVSKTTPGRLGARVIAPIRVAFRHRNDVGTQDEGTFAAQWLAMRSPVNASPIPSRYLRMTRGRCGSLLLHRDGLAPSTPCRSPAHSALPYEQTSLPWSACLKSARGLVWGDCVKAFVIGHLLVRRGREHLLSRPVFR